MVSCQTVHELIVLALPELAHCSEELFYQTADFKSTFPLGQMLLNK